MEGADLILLYPMLATGGSVAQSVSALKEAGARRIRFMPMLVAPEGVAAIDLCLSEKGYITPRLGDAGDRLFGMR